MAYEAPKQDVICDTGAIKKRSGKELFVFYPSNFIQISLIMGRILEAFSRISLTNFTKNLFP